MRISRCLWTLLGILLMLGSLHAQDDLSSTITLTVDAGYGGHYRENYWLPVRVQVRNDGPNLSGSLIIRPETSGRVVSNAYSTPIDLPANSEKVAFLHILARPNPPLITVELLDTEGTRIEQATVALVYTDPQDAINIVVQDAGRGSSVNTTALHSAGRAAFDVAWGVSNIPDAAPALKAVNTLWLDGIDTNTLTTVQRSALREWVIGGGHLIVIGGPNAAANGGGLLDILPFVPTGAVRVNDLSTLAQFALLPNQLLQGETLIASGTVAPEGRVLAASGDDPLLIRRGVGGGTVDYLTADPLLDPLSTWTGRADLWQQMIATANPRPFWTQEAVGLSSMATAMAILPGVELLPPVGSMALFLLAYIILIGPINYWILNRLNRRGWAWLTIPICIIAFTALAWSVGFNLRGSNITLSRIQVVQTWPDQKDAQVEQYVSILAPRRAVYSLQPPPSRLLRVLPTVSQGGLLTEALAQSTANIIETNTFTAERFAVDGGIFANFGVSGTRPQPNISGTFTLSYQADGTQAWQGSIRNEGDKTLYDGILLARGVVYALKKPLAPGDLITFDPTELPVDTATALAAPAPLELPYARLPVLRENFQTRQFDQQTQRAILNEAIIPAKLVGAAAQKAERRRAIITSYMFDQFGATAYGNHVYLVGWSDEAGDDITLSGATFTPLDTTLYLIQMDAAIPPAPPTQSVTIMPDQFTWTSLERTNVDSMGGLNNLTLLPGASVVMQYRPLEGAVLKQVDELVLYLDRGSGFGRQVGLELWNWERQEWNELTDTNVQDYLLVSPRRYLGPQNTVRVRLTLKPDVTYGSAWVRRFSLMQRGKF